MHDDHTDHGTAPDGGRIVPVLYDLGDVSSIDELYLEHALRLRRVAIRKFRIPPVDAESLVHDVFINYLSARRVVRSNIQAYLVAAICNACRNYWRSQRSENQVFSNDEGPAFDAAIDDDLFEGVALRLITAEILRRLGPRCREVLRRYYLDGESTTAIAACMDTTATNVNYLMHKCRKDARDVYGTICRSK